MKTRLTKALLQQTLAIVMTLTISAVPVLAQQGNPPVPTRTKMLYHDGPVARGHANLYLIWYGGWSITDGSTQQIVRDFSANLGGSDYFLINQGYPDSTGQAPSGVSLDGRSFVDSSYSYGTDLNPLAMREIIKDAITVSSIPVDPTGIYLVIGTPDIASSSTGFCAPNTPPHHGSFDYFLVTLKYAFIGNPTRCPTTAAPQLTWPGPTPNDDFAADGIVNQMAAALSAIVTNPTGSGWFDRFGVENSTKCQSAFGTTFAVPNGSRANIVLGQRNFLLQENWVNAHKSYCAMAAPQ